MLRHAEIVSPSNTIATSATTTSVPIRAAARVEPELTARAISVLLFSLLLHSILIEIYESFLGGFIDIAFERAQPVHHAGRNRDTDLPCHDDQNNRHGQFQQRWTHNASCHHDLGRRLRAL